jgi:hypothetical protein
MDPGSERITSGSPYDNDVSYVAKDIITVYGTVTGSKSYSNQAGGNTYVPEVVTPST